MAERPLYLDHNATTPLLAEAVAAMMPYLTHEFGNPSSSHPYGRRAHDAVERARAQVAELAGAEPDEVVFTSGGTEANNLAIFGSVSAGSHVVTSTIEHPATAAPCRALERRGHRVSWVAVDGDGRVQAEAVGSSLTESTSLVTIMHANNETGVLQPIEHVVAAAHARGVAVHTDAAQSAGKLDIENLGADLVSIAGHKLGAPKGVGALIVRRGIQLQPHVVGASHERGLRPGTENVASIVALGEACRIARQRPASAREHLAALRDGLLWRLRAGVPGLVLFGHATARLPNTLLVAAPGARGSAVLAHAPELAASTGSACHAGAETPSAVLRAMGVEDQPRSRRRAPLLGSRDAGGRRGAGRQRPDPRIRQRTQAWRFVELGCKVVGLSICTHINPPLEPAANRGREC